jgi:DNA-binding NarL/FixJ family response regulator
MNNAIRVTLVDDHAMFRTALAYVLRDRGFEVVGQAANAQTCFIELERERPDVVLLDLRMPGMDGVTVARSLTAQETAPKVLIVSGYAHQNDVDEAWAAGAHGYASKAGDVEQLTDGIRAVMAGERWLSPGLPTPRPTLRTRKPLASGPLAPLSARERDVFRHVVRGLTARQTAEVLGIGIKTVETHRERILKKLAVHSVVDLVRLAAQHQLLD